MPGLKLKTQHLMTLAIEVDPESHRVAGAPGGPRRIIAVLGGRFEGVKLSGIVLPGGGDWIVERDAQTALLDARITLLTEDQALIYMHYTGIRWASPKVTEKLAQGEAVDDDRYYMRTTPRFETGADQYQWLNRVVAVATGRRPPEGPVYEVFEVL